MGDQSERLVKLFGDAEGALRSDGIHVQGDATVHNNHGDVSYGIDPDTVKDLIRLAQGRDDAA
jgi:hypothetical protein